ADHGNAIGAVAQRAQSGNVIGMQMGVDCLDQFQIELTNELQVAVHLFTDWIDDQRLAAGPAGENIRVRSRRAVEELAKAHARLLICTIQDMLKFSRELDQSYGQNQSGREIRVVQRSLAPEDY